MTRMMKAAVFKDIETVDLEDIPVPEPGHGELLVKINVALTCGTDAKTFKRGPGKKTPYMQAIHVFGHEYAGIVEQVGTGVAGFAPGGPTYEAMHWKMPACGRSGRLVRVMRQPGYRRETIWMR